MQLIIGFFLAVIVAYAAYRARSLDRSGALAAFVVGTVIFGLGGLSWAILLLTFFITSSGLSRAFKNRYVALLLPGNDLALAGIRGLVGGGQCGYLGYGIGCAQSDRAALDHGLAQGG